MSKEIPYPFWEISYGKAIKNGTEEGSNFTVSFNLISNIISFVSDTYEEFSLCKKTYKKIFKNIIY